MKTWLKVLLKRLVRQRAFWAAMLLTPLLAFALSRAATERAGGVSIGLLDSADPTAHAAVASLTTSAQTLRFIVYTDAETLRRDVTVGTLKAGYVFADDVAAAMTSVPSKSVVTRISGSGDLLSALVDEAVFAKLYAAVGGRIAADYIASVPSIADVEGAKRAVAQSYADYIRTVPRVFIMETVDGESVATHTSVTFPVRGFAAVLLLLSALLVAYTANADAKRGLHLRLSPRMRYFTRTVCCALPPLCLVPMLLLSVWAGGAWTAFLTELGAAAAYALLCAGAALLLSAVFPHRGAPTAAMPVTVLSAFALCPIFVDVTTYYPALRPVARLLPTYWYLSAIQTPAGMAVMLAAAMMLALAAAAVMFAQEKGIGRRR